MNVTQLDEPLDILAAGQFPVAELAQVDADLRLEAALVKSRREKLEALLDRLYGAVVANEYRLASKDTGTVKIAASNSLNLAIERDKTVVWDQAIIRAELGALAPVDAQHYGKVTIEVPEAKFAAAPPAIKAALAKARTVKVGRNKYTFKPVAEAA